MHLAKGPALLQDDDGWALARLDLARDVLHVGEESLPPPLGFARA